MLLHCVRVFSSYFYSLWGYNPVYCSQEYVVIYLEYCCISHTADNGVIWSKTPVQRWGQITRSTTRVLFYYLDHRSDFSGRWSQVEPPVVWRVKLKVIGRRSMSLEHRTGYNFSAKVKTNKSTPAMAKQVLKIVFSSHREALICSIILHTLSGFQNCF